MKRMTWVAGVVAVLAFSGPASAIIIDYNFLLDSSQEVPVNPSPAVGSALVTLNTATNMLSWNVSFSGLMAPVTASHFHAPAAVGVNAGVILGIAGAGATSPIVGASVISDTFESHILAGLSYVNIHTSFRPGGEIRGQVVPEPTALSLLAVGALALMRRRRA